jgi:hypothetical protein
MYVICSCPRCLFNGALLRSCCRGCPIVSVLSWLSCHLMYPVLSVQPRQVLTLINPLVAARNPTNHQRWALSSIPVHDQRYRSEPDIGTSDIGMKRAESDILSDIGINFYLISDIPLIIDQHSGCVVMPRL